MTTLQGHLFSAPLTTEARQVPVHLIVAPDTTQVIPSIQQLGVMQSVLLKPSGNPAVPYLIVDGDRRISSALKYHIETVPALITDGTRGQIAAASAILNAARSSNPLDEARSWHTALSDGQFTSVTDLAHHVHISAQTIKQRLKLLKLPETILIHVGVSIAEGVAQRLANLGDDYLPQAILAAERKLDAGEKFTGADLKLTQTARVNDLQGSLDDLFSGLPLLTVQTDPLGELINEVRRLAQHAGIDLDTLLDALRPVPASAPPRPVAPSPSLPAPTTPVPMQAARVNAFPAPAGRVNLGLRN